MTKTDAVNKIRVILDMGGTISFPYKTTLKDWYQSPKLVKYQGEYLCMDLDTKTIEDYIGLVLTNKNKHWRFRYIMDNLEDDDIDEFEDIDLEELDQLNKKYKSNQKANHKNGILSLS